MYLYLKALHIIFIVTLFAGMFYMPRLFIYNIEAGEKEKIVKQALREQFTNSFLMPSPGISFNLKSV